VQVKLTSAEEDYHEAVAWADKVQAKLDKATAATEAALVKLRKAEDKFDAVSALKLHAACLTTSD
jgi:hypothetical protein